MVTKAEKTLQLPGTNLMIFSCPVCKESTNYTTSSFKQLVRGKKPSNQIRVMCPNLCKSTIGALCASATRQAARNIGFTTDSKS